MGPAVSGRERVGPLAVHLDDVARGEYLPVQRDHHASAPRLGVCRNLRGVEDVPGAVRVAGDGISHRARDDDGLIAAQGQIQEIGRLLHRGRPRA